MYPLNFWPQNSEGFLLDLSARENINPIYKDLLDNIIISCLELIEEYNIVSIYIIGSIVTGKAKPKLSDADVILIINDLSNVSEDLPLQLKEVETKLAHDFPIVTKVSIKIKTESDILMGKEVFRRFLIKTQGLCIKGRDIKSLLPSFRPNAAIATPKIMKLDKYIDEAKVAIQNSEDPELIKIWSRKIFKVILRTCGLLVIEKENKYSNDPYTCMQMFLKYYPEYAVPLKQCLQRIENTISDQSEILTLLAEVKGILLPLQELWLQTNKVEECS